MNLAFTQFDKSKYPYLDDSYIDTYIPVAYGKIASVKLTPINSSENSDSDSTHAVYRMPDGTSNCGSVFVKDNDTWKTATGISANYDTELLTITNGRDSSGSTRDVKICDAYGYMFDGHSYPRQILQHWFAKYGKIEYTESNFDKTEWEAELDDARVQADIGLLLDDYDKSTDSKTSYDIDYLWQVVYDISSKSKFLFRVDYNASGKITARLKDYDRAVASGHVYASSDIKNNGEIPIETSKDNVYGRIHEKYYYDTVNDSYLSFDDSTYEDYVKQNYRRTQEYTDETYLVNKADALTRAAELALTFKDIPMVATVELFEAYDLRIYDVITVALMPDNLDSSTRQYAGNHDCLVIGVSPKFDKGYNEVQCAIIPDRTPLESQIAVRNESFNNITREKSTIDLINETINKNLLLTGNLAPQQVNVVADSSGVVSDFSAATGTFNVTYNGEDVTGNGSVYSVVSQTGCTGTIDPVTGVYAITALSADTGILLLKATYQDKEIETGFTVTKSYKGATGNTGATVSLTADNTVFNYDATPTPASATVTATLHNHTGTVYYNFYVDEVSVQNTTANVYTYTPKTLYADMPQNIIVRVRDGSTTGDVLAVDALDVYGVKNGVDGIDGTNGTNGTRTACIEMYKWSASAPTTYPVGSSTYTWATGAFTNPATLNGWSQTIGTGTAGQVLYRVRAV
jgi:hypothetical protein